MSKSLVLFLLFSAVSLPMGVGEIITLSELWTHSACNKEIIMSQRTDKIELRVQSVHITQARCMDENNGTLNLITHVIKADIYYKINNPECGTWNCTFRSQLHAGVSYCTIHIKYLDDTTSEQQIKIHEIIAWVSFLVLASTAVVGGIIIIVYYKKKVKRIRTKETPDSIGLRAPLELPSESEITYESVYCHRINWNLDRNSTEERKCYKKQPIVQNIFKLDENAGYIPHNNLID